MYVRQDGRKDLNRNEFRNPRATRQGARQVRQNGDMQLAERLGVNLWMAKKAARWGKIQKA